MDFGALRFDSIDSFPLVWRWTSATHSLFDARTLRSIRPVDESDARRLRSRFDVFLGLSGVLRSEMFAGLQTSDAAEDNKAAQFLSELPNPRSRKVLLSWKPGVAAVVPFELFRECWDDFCYPGSDDVLIIPESEDWFLIYHHWEQFELGRSPAA